MKNNNNELVILGLMFAAVALPQLADRPMDRPVPETQNTREELIAVIPEKTEAKPKLQFIRKV